MNIVMACRQTDPHLKIGIGCHSGMFASVSTPSRSAIYLYHFQRRETQKCGDGGKIKARGFDSC